jgi:hypothetical protein
MQQPWFTPKPEQVDQALEHLDAQAKRSEITQVKTCWQVRRGPFTVLHLASSSARDGISDATQPVLQYDDEGLSSSGGNDNFLDWSASVLDGSTVLNHLERPSDIPSANAAYPTFPTGKCCLGY